MMERTLWENTCLGIDLALGNSIAEKEPSGLANKEEVDSKKGGKEYPRARENPIEKPRSMSIALTRKS